MLRTQPPSALTTTSLTGVVLVAATLMSGCADRDAERRVYQLERDNRRLSSQLTVAQTENRLLEREREVLVGSDDSAETSTQTANAPSSSGSSAQSETVTLPGLDSLSADTDADLGQASTGHGDFVVVVASVGASHAGEQLNHFEKTVAKLNQQPPAQVDRLFGVRHPRSGGLQIVYGKLGDNAMGMSREHTKAAHQQLLAKYPDAFILNIR